MPAYRDAYLVWCFMVQMMRGGVELFAPSRPSPTRIGPEWLLKKSVDSTRMIAAKIRRKAVTVMLSVGCYHVDL
jgi:hypothetical protein